MHWYVDVLKKYADFSGRARRTEFWMFFLFNMIIAIVLAVIDAYLNTPGVIGGIYSLAVLCPNLAVAARRLHDTDRTGWWNLLCLVPCVGLILLVWFAQDSQPGSNRFGPNPKKPEKLEF